MHRHHSTVRNVLKSVFNGVKTCKTAFNHLLGTGETVFCAVLSPPAYMGFRKHRDNVYSGHCFKESFNCHTQNWFAVKQEELLGDIGSHADT